MEEQEITLDDCHTTTEIENYRVEKLKELQTAKDSKSTIRVKQLRYERAIITLNGKKKDLDIVKEKATNNIDTLETQIELARTKYWSIKG